MYVHINQWCMFYLVIIVQYNADVAASSEDVKTQLVLADINVDTEPLIMTLCQQSLVSIA